MAVYKASKYILSGVTPGPSKSIAQSILIKNGYIHPIGKGLYSLLPLGQRVIDKLSRLIDTEMENINALKMSMPILGPKELWDRTDRWNTMGQELFHLTDRSNSQLCLQPTAEEMVTQIVAQLPQLRKSIFPLLVYQTTEKFRDEMNPRFGLVRSRQFLMKDLYSFDLDKQSASETYDAVLNAYGKILKHHLKLKVFKVNASSGVHGGPISHEYHIRNSLGEDGIHFCNKCKKGVKADEFESIPSDDNCSHKDQTTYSTLEIAHTFQLGTRYSQSLKALHSGSPLEMCCYGIGVTRLLPAAVESLCTEDSSAVRLPKVIAPFDIAVVVNKELANNVFVEILLTTLRRRLKGGVLLDDRTEMNVGRRLKELEKIGIPRMVVVGKKTQQTLQETPRVEYIVQNEEDGFQTVGELTVNELLQALE